MAVINGLTWAPVERLNLYNELSGKMQQKFQELRQVFGLGDNFNTIRTEIAKIPCDKLCVPVLSICLKDVFMTEDN